MFNSRLLRGLLISGVVLASDQFTKYWIILYVMQPPQVIEVFPFFNLVMGWNYGVSFGMLNSAPEISTWLLPSVVITIITGLLFWLFRVDNLRQAIGLGFIIGGAIGNLIDRLIFGAVADFLDFHIMGYHWPAFNIADAAITVGAIVMIIDTLFAGEKKP
jgi:signal peptidase II